MGEQVKTQAQGGKTHFESAEPQNSGRMKANQLIENRFQLLSSTTLQCRNLEDRILSLVRANQIVETALISLNAIEAILLDAKSLLQKCGNVQSTQEKKALNLAYEEFCNQITLFSDDVSYEGQNLLRGDTIKVDLDESGDTSIKLVGEEISARALGLIDDNGVGTEKLTYYSALERIEEARPLLRAQIAIFETRYNLLKNRIDLMEKLYSSFENRVRKLSARGSMARSLKVIVGTLNKNEEVTPATLEGTAVAEEMDSMAKTTSSPEGEDYATEPVVSDYTKPFPVQTGISATVGIPKSADTDPLKTSVSSDNSRTAETATGHTGRDNSLEIKVEETSEPSPSPKF